MSFVIRPFAEEDDLPRLLRLHLETKSADPNSDEDGEAQLRAELGLPNHQPGRDGWVAEAPGNPEQLAGYALIQIAPGQETAKIYVMVHPAWRKQGLGKELLRRALEQSSQRGARCVQTQASPQHSAAIAFLRQNGFVPLGVYTELRAAGDLRLPSPAWPYGYALRTYAQTPDPAVLAQAINQCYQGLWGHREVSQEELTTWLPKSNWDGLFLVSSPSGKTVGICRAEPNPERSKRNGVPTGYIDAPGLTHHHRRVDLYRALLITAVRWLQSQGQKLIEMESWGDKSEVIQMYQEMGFQILRQITAYQRDLDA